MPYWRKLKNLGFEITAKPGAMKMVMGRIDAAKLKQLSELTFIIVSSSAYFQVNATGRLAFLTGTARRLKVAQCIRMQPLPVGREPLCTGSWNDLAVYG